MVCHINSLSRALSKLAQQEASIDAKFLPLLSALKENFNIDDEEFIKANRTDLDKIASIANGHFEYLGFGGEGFAWKIGGSRAQYVLKISLTPRTDQEKDVNETSSRLWGAKPGADHEPAIHSSGKLTIVYYGSKPDKEAWWKVLEYLDTESIDRYAIKTIVSEIYHLYRRTIHIDVTNVAVRKDVAADLARQLRGSSRKLLILAIRDLDDILAADWLETFIDGILYMIESRQKTDFMAGNVGVREATGQLIWFDA